MQKYLKFSVITPSFNQGNYIEENIQSVLNQNYPNFEHIIMDGGSRDNTIEILKKYLHLIWKSEPDKGQADAINQGLKIATGDVICWLNSDDFLENHSFYIVNNILIEHSDLGGVVGDINVVNEFGNILEKRSGVPYTFDYLLNINYSITQQSTFIKKERLDKVGGLNDYYNYVMDYELLLRLTKGGSRFSYVDRTLANFRIHGQSKTMMSSTKFLYEIIDLKIMYKANILTSSNFRIIYYLLTNPLRKIKSLRNIIRQLKSYC